MWEWQEDRKLMSTAKHIDDQEHKAIGWQENKQVDVLR